MAVSWNPKIMLRLTETISVDGIGSQQFDYTEFDRTTGRYYASSTVTATKCVVDKLALTGGAATIDLTALTGPNGAAVTFSGLKVIGGVFFLPTTNSGASLTIAKGASNGYELQSTHSIICTKGCWHLMEFGSRPSAVGGSNKTLDLSGTSTDQLWYALVAGL
jgi:hypothetical protein